MAFPFKCWSVVAASALMVAGVLFLSSRTRAALAPREEARAATERNPAAPGEKPLPGNDKPKGRISGTVLDAGGKPIEGVEVLLFASGADAPSEVAGPAAGGVFAFDVALAGTHEVHARARGFARAVFEEIAAGTEGLQMILQPEALLSGKVIRDEDASPVEGALVCVNLRRGGGKPMIGSSVLTDRAGRFELRELPGISTLLSACHEDLVLAGDDLQVQLAGGRAVAGQVLRMRKGIEIAGKVVASYPAGKPIPDAEVVFDLPFEQRILWTSAFRAAKKTRTQPDGTFSLRGLSEGEHEVSLAAEGYVRESKLSVSIKAPGEREIELSLEEAGTIAGRVLDEDGRPVAGARVGVDYPWVSSEDRALLRDLGARTDGDGRYRIAGLHPNGGYVVFATHEEHAAGWRRDVKVYGGEAIRPTDIRLPKGRTIRGRVLDEEGRGIEGCKVTCRATPCGIDVATLEEEILFVAERAGTTTTTDEEGSYEIPRLRGECYSISAEADGFLRPQERESEAVRFSGSEPSTLKVIHLRRPRSISGRVVDAGGRPLVEARIEVDETGGAPKPGFGGRSTKTDGEGRFELGNLGASKVWIVASMPGSEHRALYVDLPAADILLTLDREAVVAGQVRSTAEGLLPPFKVRALDQQGREWAHETAREGSPGLFEIIVPKGRYVLQAEAHGFAPSRSEEITLEAGERQGGVVIELLPPATIEGKVVVQVSGEPIDRAEVSFVPAVHLWIPEIKTATDFEGKFLLEGLPEGAFVLVAGPPTITEIQGLPDLAPAIVKGEAIRAGEKKTLNLELGRAGALRGIIRNRGRPARESFLEIEDARVYRKGAWHCSLDVSVDGEFEQGGLKAGDYDLSVSGTYREGGPFRLDARASVKDGQITDIEIDERRVLVTGQVACGITPAGGLSVEAVDPWRHMDTGYRWEASARTDSRGNYAVRLPPGRRIFLLVGDESRGKAQLEIIVPEEKDALAFDIDLPAGECAGTVVEKGTVVPIPEATVEIFRADADFRSHVSLGRARKGRCQTDSNGNFKLSYLPPGSYVVRASASFFGEGLIEGIRIDEGSAARDLRVPLEWGVPIWVKALDRRGYPIEDAMVIVRDPDGNLTQGSSAIDLLGEGRLLVPRTGAFELALLAPGFAPSRVPVQVTREPLDMAVTLSPGGKLKVRVNDPTGAPVQGAEAEILNDRGESIAEILAPDPNPFIVSPSRRMFSDRSGSIVLDHLIPGAYRVSARKGSSRSNEVEVSVSEERPADANLVVSE